MILNIKIVVPCFNEEARLNIKKWNEIIRDNSVGWYFINDGSFDQTANLLNKINCSGVINFEKNLGKAEAIRNAYLKLLDKEPFEIFGYIDSDHAFGEKDVERLIKLSQNLLQPDKNVDAVWAARVALGGRDIKRNNLRHIVSRIITTIFGFFYKNFPYDSQSGFKFFKNSDNFKNIMETEFKTRWIFEVEILNRWKNKFEKKLNIWEEPVMEWSEIGQSKINFREFFRIFFEILKVIKIIAK